MSSAAVEGKPFPFRRLKRPRFARETSRPAGTGPAAGSGRPALPAAAPAASGDIRKKHKRFNAMTAHRFARETSARGVHRAAGQGG
jgi:hypothetical protein